MQTIKFKERAVAFIDVLGFKSIAAATGQGDGKHTELEELIQLLKSTVPNLDGTVDPSIHKSLIPKHICISDSIILSAPLTSRKMSSYRGLSVLVMRVIQISHTLLDRGYLIRGGISVGPVWQTHSNIVGPAYQEAYQIETKTIVPRVELSQSAKELWSRTEDSSNTMCLQYRNHFMVNLLHDHYIKDHSRGGAERTFEKYSKIIEPRFPVSQ